MKKLNYVAHSNFDLTLKKKAKEMRGKVSKLPLLFSWKNLNFVLLSAVPPSANPIPACIAFFLQEKEELQQLP